MFLEEKKQFLFDNSEIIKRLHQPTHKKDSTKFLDLLGGSHTFQTFDDSKSKKQSLAKVFHGTIEQHEKQLEYLNGQGAGIFVTINQTDGLGRKTENITKVRALFIDSDKEGAISDITERPFCKNFPPSIIVESSPGKHHLYWLFQDEIPLHEYSELQKGLISLFHTDRTVHDLPRVMRVPGFTHNKNAEKPFVSKLISVNGGKYSLKNIKSFLNQATARTDKYAQTAFNNAVQSILNTPEGSRNNELNRNAIGLFALVKANRLDEENVWNALYNAGLQIGLSDSETKTTLQSAKKAAQPRLTVAQPEKYHASPPANGSNFEIIFKRAENLDAEDAAGIKELILLSEPLNSAEKEIIFRKIKDKTRTSIGALKEIARNAKKNDKPDHLELARLVLQSEGSENIISVDQFVYGWNQCGVWKILSERTVKQKVQSVIEQYGAVTKGLIDGVVDVFKTDIHKAEHSFNIGAPDVVNCLNGELHLDISTGGWSLKPHQKENYRTTQIPVVYDPHASAPRFLRFLEEIFEPDSDGFDKQSALLEMMGYSLMAHCKYEKFVLLIGSGANGKSVLLYILEAIAGLKNVSGVQPEQFDNRFQRAHLHEKLVNVVTEIKQGEVIADAALKSIVSGELVTVENKKGHPFEMRPFSTCWFGTNHMPHTRDFSAALFRRALIIQFNRVFSEGQNADPDLKTKLVSEIPGILNLALGAYASAVKNGFTKPASSEAAKQEWRLEADQAAQFVEEICEKDDFGRVQMSVLYTRYKAWASDNGIWQMLSMKSFRDRLSRLGFGKDKDRNGRYVTGLNIIQG